MRILHDPTPESIAAALDAMMKERAAIKALGIDIQANGRISTGPVLIHCYHCTHVSSARTEGRALKSLASHILRAHAPKER